MRTFPEHFAVWVVAVFLSAGVGVAEPVGVEGWSEPTAVVRTHGRLAVGEHLHVVGHEGGDLVHRLSQDSGQTWGRATVIGEAKNNVPMMYGGLFASGESVYVLTARGDMGGKARPLDFRKSADDGASWTDAVRVTGEGMEMFRARIAGSGQVLHVVGTGHPTPSARLLYFRSVDGGATWEPGRVLADGLGPYGGGQSVAVEGDVVHVAYTRARNGPGGGDTLYIRSTDGGKTWSEPVEIGEEGESSNRQARVQIVAADGRVLVAWQREAGETGGAIPAERLGYNRSSDAGVTWAGAMVLPGGADDRNHQQVYMEPGGRVHVCWRVGDTANDAVGYMASPDYGRTWGQPCTAFDTEGANHPYSLVADGEAVHLLTGPLERMLYARLPQHGP